jgi:hypothetical protein
MTDDNLEALAAEWTSWKETERVAVERRRTIEDRIVEIVRLDQAYEGTTTTELQSTKLKIVNRFSRKVDSTKLQELAAEAGITEHLSALFRWTPEIAAAAWKAADPSITQALLPAITTTPGRPSFSLEPKKGK